MTKIIDYRRDHIITDSITAYLQTFNVELQRLLPNSKAPHQNHPLASLIYRQSALSESA